MITLIIIGNFITGMLFLYITWKFEKWFINKYNENGLWFYGERFSIESKQKIISKDFTGTELLYGILLGYFAVIIFLFSFFYSLISILNNIKIEDR
ncbi:MAG: hypothetical protein ACOC33_02820 [bacterium]